jgi:hypothetical protein
MQSGQNWDLFGYDVRKLGKYWQAAWREFLWGYDSPLKSRLDEAVKVRAEDGVCFYQSGEEVAAVAKVACEAVLLPDSLALAKVLDLPLAVESDLDAVMALEVNANSPFPADDTGSGWKVLGRTQSQLQVQLVIVSLSATMRYLGSQYDSHDAHAQEVWARVGDSVIVLSGFGERTRLQRYNRRLRRVAGMLAYCALMLILVSALAAGTKYLELGWYKEVARDIERSSAGPAERRSTLMLAGDTIAAVQDLALQYPQAHRELARLTRLLGDEAYVVHFAMTGREIRLRGRATDAAAVMQQLTDEPAYAAVTAPQAITRIGDSGLEQFYINIELAGEDET